MRKIIRRKNMKKSVKFTVMIAVILTAVSLSACGKENTGSPEAKYDIRNATVVCSDQGAVEYYHTGNGTDEKTVYELGSNGKTVAAYTALAMVEEGLLDLDEKIMPYLDPELITEDGRMKDITLRQLLCHTAGFSPSYEFGIDQTIYTDPGAFCYSGVGYIYLQNVIENASGMTMDQAASKYVFEPLGMKHSTFESAKTIHPYMNAGTAVLYALLIFVITLLILSALAFLFGKLTGFKFYSFANALLVCFTAAGTVNILSLLFLFSSNFSKVLVLFLILFAIMGTGLLLTKKHPKLYYAIVPAGTVFALILGFVLPVTVPVTNTLIRQEANCAYTFKSTGEDMALFCDELMNKAGDSGSRISDMFEPAVTIDEKNAWGLGIAIEYTEEGKPVYWHSGINPGYQSLYVLYPAENKYIVILTNSDRGLDYSKEKARSFLGVDGTWDIQR